MNEEQAESIRHTAGHKKCDRCAAAHSWLLKISLDKMNMDYVGAPLPADRPIDLGGWCHNCKESFCSAHTDHELCILCGSTLIRPQIDFKLPEKVSPTRRVVRTKWTKVPGFALYKKYIWPNQCLCCLGQPDTVATFVSGLDKVLIDSGLAKIGKFGNVQVEFDSYNKKYIATLSVPYCKDCRTHDKWGNVARGLMGCAASIVGLFLLGFVIVLIFVGTKDLTVKNFQRLSVPVSIVLVLAISGYLLKRIAAGKKKESCPVAAAGIFTPLPIRSLLNAKGVTYGIEFAQGKYAAAFAQANGLRCITELEETEEPGGGKPLPVIAEQCGGCGGSKDLQLVYDKKKNRGFLCNSCMDRYQSLLQPDSPRNFWMCRSCHFRVLAGTDIDARVDESSKCPNCLSDLRITLANLKNDCEIASGLAGEPIE